jgi:hypothetical protein
MRAVGINGRLLGRLVRSRQVGHGSMISGRRWWTQGAPGEVEANKRWRSRDRHTSRRIGSGVGGRNPVLTVHSADIAGTSASDAGAIRVPQDRRT